VNIGVIPGGIRLELAPMHGFVLLDDSMLIVDIFNSGILSRNGADIASYTRVFEVFEAQSEPPGPMLDKYEAYYLDRVRARHPAS
jgi:hypothetical protein